MPSNSFASNGECGLKPEPASPIPVLQQNSFASNGECGLKRQKYRVCGQEPGQFIRQQWRMWIETTGHNQHAGSDGNSFASNGECGLKLVRAGSALRATQKFIRQQWRMWIETGDTRTLDMRLSEFIRQQWRMWIETSGTVYLSLPAQIHSPAMANVD